MPCSLSDSGSSFCCLRKQCPGDQQFFIPLVYLHSICIFIPSIDTMMDQSELVFSRLKEFHLKCKQKKYYFFITSVLFLCHVLNPEGISANNKKVQKVMNWLTTTNVKDLHSFLGLVSYYQCFIHKLVKKSWSLHQLISTTVTKNKKKPKDQKKEKSEQLNGELPKVEQKI